MGTLKEFNKLITIVEQIKNSFLYVLLSYNVLSILDGAIGQC